MADIVERLRVYAADVLPSYPNDICSAAAAEIERLRAILEAGGEPWRSDLVERLQGWATDWNGQPMVRGEPPRDGIHCDVLIDAANTIVNQGWEIDRLTRKLTPAEPGDPFTPCPLCGRGETGEVEKLRTEIAHLKADVVNLTTHRDGLVVINRQLEEQNEKLREALKPFAAFYEKAEAFVAARAKDGGSPILPSTDFRLADFKRAHDALTNGHGAGDQP